MTKITEKDLEGVTLIKPRPGPQTDFIASEADIAIYGGAVGPEVGKGWALAFMAGRHFEAEGYAGAIFRSNYVDLVAPGGLIELARGLYGEMGATLRADRGMCCHSAIWPSGARVRVGAVKDDQAARSLGAARFAFVGFDELTEFTEFQFWKLASRARLDCGVRPHIRATVTADGASWVRELIAWWIGDDGFPIPERSGVLRWFVKDDDGDILWGDTREDVARRAVDSASFVASVTFIPGAPVSNPMHAVLGQDEALRLRGNWNTRSARDSSKLVPDSDGWWLIDDGSEHGEAVFVHGLQFDWDGNLSNTNLAAYTWRGRLGLVAKPDLRVASGLPTGPGLWVFGDGVVRVVREADGSLAFDVATETERLPVAECRESPWGGRVVLEGADEKAKAAAISRVVDGAAAELERLLVTGSLTLPAGATIGGGREHVVERAPVGVSCLDSAEYLSATPTGARRSVTETSGDESLTFEDDRRLPAASEADASELAKLEANVRKVVDGNFGAVKIPIGGLDVYVADPRYTTAVSGGINVSTSPTPRPGGE